MKGAETAAIIDEAIEKDHRRGKAMQDLQWTQRSRRYRIGAAAYLYAALCTAGVGAVATMARADYPERQITMIVCFPAGGGTDIAARLMNTRLGRPLGKRGVIENRGGPGGNIRRA